MRSDSERDIKKSEERRELPCEERGRREEHCRDGAVEVAVGGNGRGVARWGGGDCPPRELGWGDCPPGGNISPLRGMWIFDKICSAETKQGVNNYEKITYSYNSGSVRRPLCKG